MEYDHYVTSVEVSVVPEHTVHIEKKKKGNFLDLHFKNWHLQGFILSQTIRDCKVLPDSIISSAAVAEVYLFGASLGLILRITGPGEWFSLDVSPVKPDSENLQEIAQKSTYMYKMMAKPASNKNQAESYSSEIYNK